MIHPKIAFIGVGENNFYGHPSDIVIKRLQERNIYILRTDQDGNFCVRDYGYHHYVFKHHT
jgi:competence protein ComEC